MGSLLLGLFLLFILQTSEGQEFVNPEPGTRVIITRISTAVSNCTVCVGDVPACSPQTTLSDPQSTTVTFTCPRPQEIFSVEVNREIDCSKSCTQDTIHPASSILPDFDRIFTWDLKVSPTKAFQLDFPAPGMKQIPSSEQCLDKHTYTIFMYSRAGTVPIGTFCQAGTVSRMQVLWKGRVSLAVPRGTVLNSPDFNYSEAIVSSSAGSVIADVVLARGMSDTDFFSPSNIPNDYIMKWNFVVPPVHNFTVNFVTYTEPKCQSKVVKVLYQQDNKPPIDKTLADNQLTNYQGNFSLSLTNCEVKKGVPGLFLHFRVSVFRSGTPYLCTVDLQNDKALSVKLEHTTLDSFCELSVDSVVQKAVTVLPGSKALLSFLDCHRDELLLTATKTIECQNLPSCSLAGIPLTVPALDACLPTPLQEVAWVLQMPQGVAMELKAPQGSLKQSAPGQDCFAPMSVLVSEADGSSIGCFSSLGSKGYIDKVQITSNVTVTAVAGVTGLSQNGSPFLSVSFSPRISENLIYTMSLSPLGISPVFLMTPKWPEAMKSDSTSSWIVNIPEEYNAELSFLNVSLPSCQESHAEVIVKEMGSENELGYREDGTVPEKLSLSGSFYLNMSNCESAGRFAILSQLSLQKKSKKVLSIILGVIGVLLAVLLIVLIAVCVIVRKKKRQLTNRSSIFMPKGAASLPGDASFMATRANNESHVYDYIDDTMVYGHLLNEDGQRDGGKRHFNGHQVDTYRTFPGSTDPTGVQSEPDRSQGAEVDSYRPFLDPSESFLPPRPRSPLGPLNSVGFEDRRMVDNELYTFRNVGDLNTITLFDDDRLPPPDVEYDDAF